MQPLLTSIIIRLYWFELGVRRRLDCKDSLNPSCSSHSFNKNRGRARRTSQDSSCSSYQAASRSSLLVTFYPVIYDRKANRVNKHVPVPVPSLARTCVTSYSAWHCPDARAEHTVHVYIGSETGPGRSSDNSFCTLN